MKRFPMVFLFTLAGLVSLAATLSAQDYKGLWVGTATLKYVSEVNKHYADLSFDLGLAGAKAHDSLITKATVWRYDNSGTQPPPDWIEPAYDDSGWPSDNTPISPPNQTTTYFRKQFTVDEPSLYSGLRVRVWRDDGAVLYLNGEEIFRNNMPAGSVYFATTALSEMGDDIFVEFTLPATLLQTGENLFAAEIHPAEGSTDLSFDLALTAALADPATTALIDMEATGWKYDDSGATNVPVTWRDTGFDDAGWEGGQGQFGFGENDEKTTVSESAGTIYFRKKFSGPALDFTHLRVLLLRDDGAVVYVNGEEILRSNMPAGAIAYGTSPVKALGSADEGRYLVVDVELGQIQDLVLNSGTDTNVVAVEVHQHPAELGGSTGGGGPALTRTSAPFDLRLLLHVDGGGAVKLLKEVIQMFNSETGQYDLLTDHTQLSDPKYEGVAVRDGVPVGRRLSSVGFDFVGSQLGCDGTLSPGAAVTCNITLASSHPTNPFRHRYHPDHDNWDERYENTVAEAYAVTRDITITFSDRYPPDEDLPVREVTPSGWGFDLLGGTYGETLTGLYRDEIKVEGPFILRRVVTTETLTP